MDSQFRLPGTNIRFGLDPVIGLVPGVGDTATLLIGMAMLAEAKRLHAGPSLYGRLAGNLAFDWLVGLVPGIDLIADTAVKAHSKNAALLARHARQYAIDANGTDGNRRQAGGERQPPWTKGRPSKMKATMSR